LVGLIVINFKEHWGESAMRAYCINLDRRADRLEHMQAQFDRQSIRFERIAAVNGQAPDIAAAAAACMPGISGRRMSAGAYACFQSHRKAWRRLLDTRESHALVFEDDLVLAEGFSDLMGHHWIPKDADLVKLETFNTRMHLARQPKYDVAGRDLLRLRSRHVGSGCYAISARFAPTLLAMTEEIAEPPDEFMFSDALPSFGKIVTYQMTPAAAIQGNLLSTAKTGSGWADTSITERFMGGDSVVPEAAETLSARAVRRLTQEVRAKLYGTQYVVVPFK
jgi:glycosyl transferase, family 25